MQNIRVGIDFEKYISWSRLEFVRESIAAAVLSFKIFASGSEVSKVQGIKEHSRPSEIVIELVNDEDLAYSLTVVLKCCSKLSLLFIRLCKISTNGIMWPEKPGVIDDAK